MSESTTAPPGMHTDQAEKASSRFYMYLAGWMWLLVCVGFGPGYFAGLTGQIEPPTIPVHIHALVYVGWLALFTYQVSLPARGQTARHRQLGQYLVGYAMIMVLVGLFVTFSRFGDRVAADQFDVAQQSLIHPLSDMFVFPILFGLAVAYRRRPEVHKRMMVVATNMLLIAAVGRMTFFGEPVPLSAYYLLWLSPIWIGVARDMFAYRRLHPVYVLSAAVLAVVPLRSGLVTTGTYQNFTVWLAGVIT